MNITTKISQILLYINVDRILSNRPTRTAKVIKLFLTVLKETMASKNHDYLRVQTSNTQWSRSRKNPIEIYYTKLNYYLFKLNNDLLFITIIIITFNETYSLMMYLLLNIVMMFNFYIINS